jgi:hypothetical protein
VSEASYDSLDEKPEKLYVYKFTSLLTHQRQFNALLNKKSISQYLFDPQSYTKMATASRNPFTENNSDIFNPS